MQKILNIDANAVKKRLDVFLTNKLSDLTRSSITKLIESGSVLVNKNQEKPGYKLKPKDIIEVDLSHFQIPDSTIQLPILYEDDDVMVINKPAGVLTHSKGALNPEATVASFIKDRINFPPDDDPNDRAGIVHRLDRATSGVIICAKNEPTQKWLQKQFAERKTKKTYVAIVDGAPEPKEAIIDMPIARNPRNPKTFYVSPNGKRAVTHYRATEELPGNKTLVVLKPETGRTHQLRVHLHYLGHPIVGDILYKGSPNERMLLHAHKLEIQLPSKETKEFIAELPQAFHTTS